MRKRKVASEMTPLRRSKRLRKLVYSRSFFDTLSQNEATKFVEHTKDLAVSKTEDFTQSEMNLNMALSLLRIGGAVGNCAREKFQTVIDTEKSPKQGEGLRLSLSEDNKDEFIELLGLMHGNISNVTICRSTIPSWYGDVLADYTTGDLSKLVVNMSHLDTKCAIEFKEMMKLKDGVSECTAEECGLMLDNILNSFDSVDRLEVNVFQVNKHYISVLAKHACKVVEMKVTFQHYDIWGTYTFGNIGRTCDSSLQVLEVFGNLAQHRDPSFLGLDQVSDNIANCKVSFNGEFC